MFAFIGSSSILVINPFQNKNTLRPSSCNTTPLNSNNKRQSSPVFMSISDGNHKKSESDRLNSTKVAKWKLVFGAISLVTAGLFSTPIRTLSNANAAAKSSAISMPSATKKESSPLTSSYTIEESEKSLAPPSIQEKALNTVKKIAPSLLILLFVVLAVQLGWKKFQQSQMERIKKQLGAMGGFDFEEMEKLLQGNDMLGGSGSAGKKKLDAAEMARKILQQSASMYKDDDDGKKGGMSKEELAAKMRINFGAEFAADEVVEEEVDLNAVLLPGETKYELLVRKLLVEPADADRVRSEMVDAAVESDLATPEEMISAFGNFCSVQVSCLIDKVAVNLESDDRQSLTNLNALATAVRRMNAIALATFDAADLEEPEEEKESNEDKKEEEKKEEEEKVEPIDATDLGVPLMYAGTSVTSSETRMELYKRFAVYCLSSEKRVEENVGGLQTLQRMLDIDDKEAFTVTDEIARGMFQVAVSSRLADGNLDPETKQALEELKGNFSQLLDKDVADSIEDETSLMRVVYGLQKMIKERGLTTEDARELRRLSKEMGVDLNDILSKSENIEGLGLGPEGKELFDTIKSVLAKADEEEAKAKAEKAS
eukprot:CAMPEP_0182446504 /NCGR_PEP_ID=MMETSP1172-20130603/4247_1 /TAXON_ID=708627 /ORGANISM="Timspurckia oligopyrenoides, Strain CCMP3278" /LENGTH=598 /DNA_ID=CAMNT_0024642447 /DNA_START=17 /DNA_END=1813 /DNA_ORIENTATION=+